MNWLWIVVLTVLAAKPALAQPARPTNVTPKAEVDETALVDFPTAKQCYATALAPLESEHAEKLAKLRDDYLAELEQVRKQMLAKSQIRIALALQVERERVLLGQPLTETGTTEAPYEVLALRKPFEENVSRLNAEHSQRATQAVTRYRNQLDRLAAYLLARGQPGMAVAVKLENLRTQPDSPLTTAYTAHAGGGGGRAFTGTVAEAALLVGLNLRTGDFAGHKVIVAIQPIWLTPTGRQTGPLHGVAGPMTTVEARPGYAVGALHVNSGDRVDGFEVVFMRIKSSDASLMAGDSYRSPWFGGKDGGKNALLAGDGQPVVGIFGKGGRELDSLGLIQFINPQAVNLERSLLLHLPLTNNFADSSLNQRHAAANGAVQIRHGAACFDGKQSWLTLPHLPFDQRPFAVSVWAKLDGPLAEYGLLQQRGGDGAGQHLHLMLRYNLQPYFGFYMNDLTAASSLPRAPAWTHLLFQFTGQRQEIWINGKLDAARDSTGYRGQQGEMLVGKPPSWHNVPAAHWHGALRSLRIYGRALSPAEIEQLSKEQPTKGKPS